MLLILDPGISTGWAVFADGKPLLTGVIPNTLIQQGLDNLKGSVTEVVAEQVPVHGFGKLARELEDVLSAIRTTFPDAHWIPAGQWKPVTGSVDLKALGFSAKRTQHERDALRIGIWWLRRDR